MIADGGMDTDRNVDQAKRERARPNGSSHQKLLLHADTTPEPPTLQRAFYATSMRRAAAERAWTARRSSTNLRQFTHRRGSARRTTVVRCSSSTISVSSETYLLRRARLQP